MQEFLTQFHFPHQTCTNLSDKSDQSDYLLWFLGDLLGGYECYLITTT